MMRRQTDQPPDHHGYFWYLPRVTSTTRPSDGAADSAAKPRPTTPTAPPDDTDDIPFEKPKP
jgi:hypothetical protein